jgi:hypothetical protein
MLLCIAVIFSVFYDQAIIIIALLSIIFQRQCVFYVVLQTTLLVVFIQDITDTFSQFSHESDITE